MKHLKTINIENFDKKKQNKGNKLFLTIFLGIAIFSLLLKIIIGILLDMGLVHGIFHIGFGNDPQNAFLNEFNHGHPKKLHDDVFEERTFSNFLDDNPSIKKIIEQHPNFIGFWTQFTGLTTIILIIFLTFRLFKFDGDVPRGLHGVMKQRTLSLITMYDLIVGVVFGSSMSHGFLKSFSDTLLVPEVMNTVIVHALIPLSVLVYSVIFLIYDKHASRLNLKFALKGTIYPLLYSFYYALLTVIGSDPYPVTHMHQNLIHGGGTHGARGASEIGKLPALLLIIFFILNFIIFFHNLILKKINKHGTPENDHDETERKKHKREHFIRISNRRNKRKARKVKNSI